MTSQEPLRSQRHPDAASEIDDQLESLDQRIADDDHVDSPNDTRLRGAAHLLKILNRMKPGSSGSDIAGNTRGDPPDPSLEKTHASEGESSPDGSQFGELAETLAIDLSQDASTIRIDDYQVIREISRGGMGVVFCARHVQLDRQVALKMMLAGPLATDAEKQRFRIEAEAAAQLDHPGIVPIFQVGDYHGLPYFTMGFIEGESLARRISRGPLDPIDAAHIAIKVAEATHYAHSRGVLHRDIKPLNVLIENDGQPRLVDFGLARRVDSNSNLTGTGQILGTPSFMAPEQAAGNIAEVTAAADIYAIGATLYCMLTGRPPLQAANPIDTIRMVLDQDPVPVRSLNPSVPVDLATICMKCLQKEPRQRYESAAALADDLRRFISGEPIKARPVTRIERITKWARRNPVVASLMATIATALITLLVGGIWYQHRLSTALAETQRERDNVAQEKAATTKLLYRSLTSEAQYLNDVKPPGFASRAWDLIKRARYLDTPAVNEAELRQLAVRTMSQGAVDALVHFTDLNARLYCADITPDGQHIVVGCDSGTVLFLNPTDQTVSQRFDLNWDQPVSAIRILGDDRVITADFCRRIVLWERDSDDQWHLETELTPEPPPMVYDVRLTPDATESICWVGIPTDKYDKVLRYAWNEYVAQVSYDPQWEKDHGASIERATFAIRPISLANHSQNSSGSPIEQIPLSVSRLFAYGGNRLAVAYDHKHLMDKPLLIYDRVRKDVIQSIKPNCGTINQVCISKDGRWVAVAGHLHAEVYDVDSGQRVASLAELGRSFVYQFIGDQGDLLVRRGMDVMLYSCQQHQIVRHLPNQDEDWRTRFTSDERHWIALGDQQLKLDRAGTVARMEILAHSKMTREVSFSPDDQCLVSSGDDDPIRIWDTASGDRLAELPGRAACFHPTGRYLAVHTGQHLQLWSIVDGQLVAEIPSNLSLYRLQFNPPGTRLVAVGYELDSISMWRIENLDATAESSRPAFAPIDIPAGGGLFSWSPSGDRIVYRSGLNTLKLVDLVEPEYTHDLAFESYFFQHHSIHFLDEDHVIVSGDKLQTWDVSQKAITSTLPHVPTPTVFSPAGKWVTNRETIVDATNQTPVFKLPLGGGAMWCMCWSPSGRRLATAMDDGRIVLWDLQHVNQQLDRLDLAVSEIPIVQTEPIDVITNWIRKAKPGSRHKDHPAAFAQDSAAARYLLRSGAEIAVKTESHAWQICRNESELPSVPFQIVGIDWYRGPVDRLPSPEQIEQLESLKQLRTLNLHRNPANDDQWNRIIESLNRMESLQSLYLSDTRVTVNHLMRLVDHPKLSSLIIHETPAATDEKLPVLRDAIRPCRVFATADDVSALYMCLNQATPNLVGIDGEGTSVSMHSIEQFPITGIRLTDVTPDPTKPLHSGVFQHLLPQCKTLRSLNLRGRADIDDSALPWLKKYSHVSVLDVRETRLSESGIRELKAAVPGIQF